MKKKLVYKATINIEFEKNVDETVIKRAGGNEQIKKYTDNNLVNVIKRNVSDLTDTKIFLYSDIKEIEEVEQDEV